MPHLRHFRRGRERTAHPHICVQYRGSTSNKKGATADRQRDDFAVYYAEQHGKLFVPVRMRALYAPHKSCGSRATQVNPDAHGILFRVKVTAASAGSWKCLRARIPSRAILHACAALGTPLRTVR